MANIETVLTLPDAFRSPSNQKQTYEIRKRPLDGQPICLPGYGLPFDSLSQPSGSTLFRHPIDGGLDSELITVRELRMLQFINQVTDKPDWERKVFDESIINKWREEAKREIVHDNHAKDVFLSEPMFDYCIQELQEKAKIYQETKTISILDVVSRVVKSDVAVSEKLRSSLVQAVKPLEEIPEKFKDWHPGSDGLVLDLVHPSLFPLIYGVSWVLPHDLVPMDCMKWAGSSDIVPAAQLKKEPGSVSFDWASRWDPRAPRSWGNYMWLPSNVSFDEAGKAHIDSYINNVHPAYHEGLYRVLEHIVDATIPLWNETFSTVKRKRIDVDATSEGDYLHPKGAIYEGHVHPEMELGPFESDEDAEAYKKQMEEQKREKENENEEDEEDEDDGRYDEDQWELEWQYKQWKVEQGVLLWPEPEEFVPTADLPNLKGVDYLPKGNGLQIIFKLANIHLTPEKSKYPGGTWHIEGALNEYIVASAIYYYDESNITESNLAFGHVLDEEDLIMLPPQGEYESAAAFFGVESDGTNDQTLGQVLTRQGRLLCFPNVLQHCVQPFELQDATKPGHRKILALFLVNPSTAKLSTANIPPQRKDWWSEEVRNIGPFADLPQELFDNIMDFVEYPLSWEQACEIREKLMEERTAINNANKDAFLVSSYVPS